MWVIVLLKRFLIAFCIVIFLPINTFATEISASSAVVIDADTKAVLYEKNAYSSRSMASTTKIMTIITALDYIYDIHVPVIIKPLDVERTQGTSGSIFSVGDIVSLEDLMYAAMLLSSNQAANAIARYAGQKILAESNFINI